MGFNELNSVEHYIIHQLRGVNLNHLHWQEEKIPYGFQWTYGHPGINSIIVCDFLIIGFLYD